MSSSSSSSSTAVVAAAAAAEPVEPQERILPMNEVAVAAPARRQRRNEIARRFYRHIRNGRPLISLHLEPSDEEDGAGPALQFPHNLARTPLQQLYGDVRLFSPNTEAYSQLEWENVMSYRTEADHILHRSLREPFAAETTEVLASADEVALRNRDIYLMTRTIALRRILAYEYVVEHFIDDIKALYRDVLSVSYDRQYTEDHFPLDTLNEVYQAKRILHEYLTEYIRDRSSLSADQNALLERGGMLSRMLKNLFVFAFTYTFNVKALVHARNEMVASVIEDNNSEPLAPLHRNVFRALQDPTSNVMVVGEDEMYYDVNHKPKAEAFAAAADAIARSPYITRVILAANDQFVRNSYAREQEFIDNNDSPRHVPNELLCYVMSPILSAVASNANITHLSADTIYMLGGRLPYFYDRVRYRYLMRVVRHYQRGDDILGRWQPPNMWFYFTMAHALEDMRIFLRRGGTFIGGYHMPRDQLVVVRRVTNAEGRQAFETVQHDYEEVFTDGDVHERNLLIASRTSRAIFLNYANLYPDERLENEETIAKDAAFAHQAERQRGVDRQHVFDYTNTYRPFHARILEVLTRHYSHIIEQNDENEYIAPMPTVPFQPNFTFVKSLLSHRPILRQVQVPRTIVSGVVRQQMVRHGIDERNVHTTREMGMGVRSLVIGFYGTAGVYYYLTEERYMMNRTENYPFELISLFGYNLLSGLVKNQTVTELYIHDIVPLGGVALMRSYEVSPTLMFLSAHMRDQLTAFISGEIERAPGSRKLDTVTIHIPVGYARSIEAWQDSDATFSRDVAALITNAVLKNRDITAFGVVSSETSPDGMMTYGDVASMLVFELLRQPGRQLRKFTWTVWIKGNDFGVIRNQLDEIINALGENTSVQQLALNIGVDLIDVELYLMLITNAITHSSIRSFTLNVYATRINNNNLWNAPDSPVAISPFDAKYGFILRRLAREPGSVIERVTCSMFLYIGSDNMPEMIRITDFAFILRDENSPSGNGDDSGIPTGGQTLQHAQSHRTLEEEDQARLHALDIVRGKRQRRGGAHIFSQ